MTSTQCSATPIATLPHKTYSQQCLQAPTRLKHCDSDFEYSIHSPPPRFQRELTHIFPAMRRQELKRILVVPVIQRCDNDMVGVTKSTNAERDVRLELVCSALVIGNPNLFNINNPYDYVQFVEWGKLVVDRLRSVGMWADIMDPASGYPVSRTTDWNIMSNIRKVH
jgi:hypothetical protein